MEEIIVGTREFFNAWKTEHAHYVIIGGYGNGVLVWNRIKKSII